MDPITLIVTALAAGATAAGCDTVKDATKAAVQAAYAKLRGLAKKRVAGQPDGEAGARTSIEAFPQKWESLLDGRADRERGRTATPTSWPRPRHWMELVDQAWARETGKYNVTVGELPRSPGRRRQRAVQQLRRVRAPRPGMTT